MSSPVLTALDRRNFLRSVGLCGIAGMQINGLAGFSELAMVQGAASSNQLSKPLTIWGIPASPSVVFARAVASQALLPFASDVKFDVWKSTDQMRAGVATGKFELFATSSYAAANFHNRGAGTTLVNVVTWGLLYLMARNDSVRCVVDLAGKHVLLSNKNEAPDLLFHLVLKWAGLKPGKDVKLDYVGSPGEAVPLYLSGRADVVLLHEPAATAALMRAQEEKKPLRRALDITELYGALTGRKPRIPQVGLAVNAEFLDKHPDIVTATHSACVEAVAWTLAHNDEAAELASRKLRLPAPVIAKSLPYIRLDALSAKEAQEDIELYFDNLMSLDPAIVGGKKPDASFYWG
ncbi:ABC transporter substrate-binding protein [Cohaesibacter celericrescens]|uniref:Sulfate ABC transporter substrate-binding protein n=1 Tax=Cohaesibacter celericrescens TaxID=2067669 RepID=A0A2N5XQ28_9HYPH|nr:MqnA/MqnD/SBP family protein [Cohaesibacter celericrescens]PLW76547.1 sulfate ABC transporter substrate-binding protein [Cohaesibacter celericrescens]